MQNFAKQDRKFCEVCEVRARDMKKLFMGVRLKRLRDERRLTQQALADALGISLSYLNQIENNQRPLTVAVLLKLNAAFGVDVQLFSDEDEARLVGELREVFASPAIGEEISAAEIREIATNMPAVGRLIVGLNSRLARALDQSAALAARLGDDRQAAAAPLAAAPFEEVRDFFYARHNHIDALDRAAEAIAAGLGNPLGRMADALEAHLRERHDIRVTLAADEPATTVQRAFELDTRTLRLSPHLTGGQRAFQMATQLAFLEFGREIDAEIAGATFTNAEARALARIGLANYFAGALILPYRAFLEAAERLHHDIDLIGRKFGVGFETVCHRLSTLQRAGARGVPQARIHRGRARILPALRRRAHHEEAARRRALRKGKTHVRHQARRRRGRHLARRRGAPALRDLDARDGLSPPGLVLQPRQEGRVPRAHLFQRAAGASWLTSASAACNACPPATGRVSWSPPFSCRAVRGTAPIATIRI